MAVVVAVVAVAGLMGAGNASAKGVAFSFFPSPNGSNGWYTQNVSGSFAFDVDGLGSFNINGYYHERLSALECEGSPTFSWTPWAESSFPFIPGNPQLPVQIGVAFGGDTTFAGVSGGCTASYERMFFDDCHDIFFSRWCDDITDWLPWGTETDFRTFRIDTSAPQNVVVNATSSPNAFGWYKSPVTFTVSGQDPHSSIQNCGWGSFPFNTGGPSLTVSTNTNSSGSSAGCRNGAGLVSGTGQGWRYDSTPPALAPTISPTSVLVQGSVATAAANATDALSLIDTANTGCDPVDTSTLGTHAVTCTATDRAGNVTTAQASYEIVYSFTGFSHPIANPPVLNDRKAGTGKAIPLRFSVSNANGPVTDLTSVEVTATSLDCNVGVTSDLPSESGTLQNRGNGEYQFEWKVPKSYAGSCKTLSVDLGDGVDHTALFRFSK